MEKSLVREAAHAFSNGDFVSALDSYKKIGDLVGRQNFMANIRLCERRIWEEKRSKNYFSATLKEIRVACVMDDFTFHSYDPECNLLHLTPDGAIDELEKFQPDLLFIESAWRGKDELWSRKIGKLSKELKSALQWCNRNHVPTVFWNKEDPIHFETFLTTAQQFDCVFTTDIDCIGRYKAALGHNRVFLLPFACQPKLHNPIELYQRKDAFCFAGAYYVRYPERSRDLEGYVEELPKFKPFEIYDRNFGKDDVNYQFPQEYQPYIVGTLAFNEIDKAYKGYRYSINLNSIKQSQSMFARRVYELLGSNTITVSNFSRGVRLLFGNLVITSDNGKEIVERLKRFGIEDEQKLRLAGLRKVMLEHTYEHRLAYVLSKSLGGPIQADLPKMLVIAFVESADQCRKVVENFRRQSYKDKCLLLVAERAHRPSGCEVTADEVITFLDTVQDANARISSDANANIWLAPMVPSDYYGPNYLLDLSLASRYTTSHIVGKAAYYRLAWPIQLINAECAYKPVPQLAQRCSAIRIDALPKGLLENPDWLRNLADESWKEEGLALDPFNYCRNALHLSDLQVIAARVDDLDLDTGMSYEQLIRIAESIDADEKFDEDLPRWSSARLLELVSATNEQIRFRSDRDGLQVTANLQDGEHQYIYSTHELPLNSLPVTHGLQTYLEATPGLDVQYVFIFFDKAKKKISHAIHTANRNHTAVVPEGTAFVRFGWRVMGTGTCFIRGLYWGHRNFNPAEVIGQRKHLVLTNHYPSYDNLYRNGFVHTRVSAYAERGVKVDVFRLRKNEAVSYHEFHDIDVITGSQEALRTMLRGGHYHSILVHFLDEPMWDVLRHQIEHTKVVVWVHGSEIQPWYRRDYNFTNEAEREAAKAQSEIRMKFWRTLLAKMPSNLKLVFVSSYFAEEVMEDLGFRLPEESYAIIHNPIDTELFKYQLKPLEQRKKILSIRPYASRTYANDLSVSAIIELSKKPFFDELDFLMIGEGMLFEETLGLLRPFRNVRIERGFKTHREIAELHRDYGIFLVPSRMDSQGVSRDEAMASGLVPITTAVGAIPEFVGNNCGVLVEAEDFGALAAGIAKLYETPKLFEALSRAAAARVRRQSDISLIIERELQLFYGAGC